MDAEEQVAVVVVDGQIVNAVIALGLVLFSNGRMGACGEAWRSLSKEEKNRWNVRASQLYTEANETETQDDVDTIDEDVVEDDEDAFSK